MENAMTKPISKTEALRLARECVFVKRDRRTSWWTVVAPCRDDDPWGPSEETSGCSYVGAHALRRKLVARIAIVMLGRADAAEYCDEATPYEADSGIVNSALAKANRMRIDQQIQGE